MSQHQLFTAYVPGQIGNGLEWIYIPAFVLAFISLGFAVRRFSRHRRSWVLFVVLAALFAYAGLSLSAFLVLN